MRILVLGLYYADNLGDAVICDCVASWLTDWFPAAQIDIRDFVNRTDFPVLQEIPMDVLIRRRPRRKLRTIATRCLHWDKMLKHEQGQIAKDLPYIEAVCNEPYDLVVFAGGQVFQDSLMLYAEAFVKRFSQRRTPILINACGTGPACSRQIERRLRAALSENWVKLVSSRDDVARINRCYLPPSKKAAATYDPALWCSEVYRIERDRTAEVIGLGIMYADSISPRAARRFWIQLIRLMEQRQLKWKIFVNGSGDDISFARTVIGGMPELSGSLEDYFAPVPRNPRQLVQMLAGFRSIISFRLHSHIISAALNVPSVAMVWDDKLRFFFRKIGHEERCCTVRDRPERVLDRLAFAEREGYDRRLLEEQKQYAIKLLHDAVFTEINDR